MSWRDFLAHYADTLGVTAVFALLGSAFLIWVGDKDPPLTRSRAIAVLAAGQFVGGIATATVHGYLGWPIWLAPGVGGVCGLVALPLIMTVARIGRRVEQRADDLTDKGIDLLPGRNNK